MFLPLLLKVQRKSCSLLILIGLSGKVTSISAAVFQMLNCQVCFCGKNFNLHYIQILLSLCRKQMLRAQQLLSVNIGPQALSLPRLKLGVIYSVIGKLLEYNFTVSLSFSITFTPCSSYLLSKHKDCNGETTQRKASQRD